MLAHSLNMNLQLRQVSIHLEVTIEHRGTDALEHQTPNKVQVLHHREVMIVAEMYDRGLRM